MWNNFSSGNNQLSQLKRPTNTKLETSRDFIVQVLNLKWKVRIRFYITSIIVVDNCKNKYSDKLKSIGNKNV